MDVRGGSDQKSSEDKSAYDAVGFGMTFALSALLFFGAGVWVDGKLGTSPLFAFIGLLVGGSAGFWWMYVKLTGAGQREKEPPGPGAGG